MKLVFLYGPVASGKLTVARALATATGLPVFHNHLVVDAVAAVFPFGSPAFVRLREQFWLSTFREAAADGRSLIFTFAPEPTVAADFPERVRSTVAATGGEVDFVRLAVPDADQERRLVNADRAAFGKMRSVDLLRQLRAELKACEDRMPPPALTIDTRALAPEEAARRVAEALRLPRTG